MNARVLWDIAPALAIDRSATQAIPSWPSIYAQHTISHRPLGSLSNSYVTLSVKLRQFKAYTGITQEKVFLGYEFTFIFP